MAQFRFITECFPRPAWYAMSTVSCPTKERVCRSRFDNFPTTNKLDYDHEHIIQCSHCKQKYLLVWDDEEWNYIKGWIHIANVCCAEKSSATHGD